VSSIAKKNAVPADLEALADNVVGEIVDGDLIVSPRPAGPHARAASVLGMDIGGPFDRGRGGPGGWWILFEPELHLSSNVLVPDIAGWRRDQMPAIPQDHRFGIRPDWLCEVISPSSGQTDRIRKLRIYGREGVGHVWLVDPLSKTLEVYKNSGGGTWTLIQGFSAEEGDAIVRAAPFDAIELDLAALWTTGS
jgi:Uma2 family endonuclease